MSIQNKFYFYFLALAAILIISCHNSSSKINETLNTPNDKNISKGDSSKLITQTFLKKPKWSEFNDHPDSLAMSGEINPILGNYLFIFKGEYKNNIYYPQLLRIKNSNQILQEIRIKKFDLMLEENTYDSYIELIDLNFDNYLDLRIINNMGATGNYWHINWLYNIAKKKFIICDFLNELSAVVPDKSRKLLYSYERNNYFPQVGLIIKPLRNYNFKIIRSLINEYNNDSCVIDFRDNNKGKWKLVKQIKKVHAQLENDFYKDSIYLKDLPTAF